MTDLPRLEHLVLSHNQIKDLKSFLHLAGNHELKHIIITGNPVAEKHFLTEWFDLIPSLMTVNGIDRYGQSLDGSLIPIDAIGPLPKEKVPRLPDMADYEESKDTGQSKKLSPLKGADKENDPDASKQLGPSTYRGEPFASTSQLRQIANPIQIKASNPKTVAQAAKQAIKELKK